MGRLRRVGPVRKEPQRVGPPPRPCGCGQKDLREIAEASAELVQTDQEGAEPPQHY